MVEVLLVNREYLFQNTFKKMLDDIKECELIGVAENALEAMRIMRDRKPGIVFVDAFLGKENGIHLCKKIKEMYRETIVYLVSNYCNYNLLKESMLSGIEDFLVKPLSKNKLSSLMTESKTEHNPGFDGTERELIASIEERDYKASCKIAEKLAEETFLLEKEQEREQKLESIVSAIFSFMTAMDTEQKEYYRSKNQITYKVLHKKRFCQLWLMQMVTIIYQQLCIFKYTHMNQVFHFIENNLKEEMSLTELSERGGISNGYLSRIFKKYYRMSVVDYIHMRKLQMAKYYMISTEMNISDISFMLGYSEAGYFCKIFKKYEGMTPSAFQNMIAKE